MSCSALFKAIRKSKQRRARVCWSDKLPDLIKPLPSGFIFLKNNGGMKIYLVGGAVRDIFLGQNKPGADRDWVVVGASPAQMLALGYLAVGKDFPVFLHPHTKEEYALARTERKTAPGYHGFAMHAAPDVSLEDDLARRDLTVNAMALPQELVLRADWPHLTLSDLRAHVIDPYGGLRAIEAKVLRHVSAAFAEDPVRILRLARFAARFEGFEVAPETMHLMRDMVAAGEVQALVAERVWQEMARGLMETQPVRMLEVLRGCGALRVLLPEVDALWGVPQRAEYHPEIDTGVHTMMVLQMAQQLQAGLAVRFACLTHDLGKATTPVDILPKHIGHEARSVVLLQKLCKRLRVPLECKELALVVAKEHGNIHRSMEFSAAASLRLLERCDALRRPERFEQVLLACECDARGRLGFADRPYPQAARLLGALHAAQSVKAPDVLAGARPEQLANGVWIAEQMQQARERAIAAVLP